LAHFDSLGLAGGLSEPELGRGQAHNDVPLPRKVRTIIPVKIEKDESCLSGFTRQKAHQWLVPSGSCSKLDSVYLTGWRNELPTSFELHASRREDGLDLMLSGHRQHHLFRRRVQFEIVVGEVVRHDLLPAANLSS
jgi:hypothetical protein